MHLVISNNSPFPPRTFASRLQYKSKLCSGPTDSINPIGRRQGETGEEHRNGNRLPRLIDTARNPVRPAKKLGRGFTGYLGIE